MEGIRYTKEIQNAVQLAEQIAEERPQEAAALFQELLDQTGENTEPQLQANLYYDLGSAYFDLHRSRKCSKSILRALGFYRKLQDWEHMAQCYNLLGISYLNQGDRASAIDAFSNELEMGEEHGLLLAQMKAYINLATTCYEIGRLADAILYSNKAMEIFQHHEDQAQSVNYWIVHLSLQCKALALQGAIAEAEESLRQLDELMAGFPQFKGTPFDRLPHFLLRVSKDHEQIDAVQLDSEIGMYMEPGCMINFVYETIEFMRELEKLGEYERLNRLLPLFEETLEPTDFYGYKLQQSRFKIDYCQHIRDNDALAKEIGNYCGYVDLQKEAVSDAMVSYLRIRTSLRDSQNSNLRLMKSNRMLKKRANTDELTSVWNRRGLNEVSDQLFDHAVRCSETFGFEMMDIDFFKTVNDTYGHDVGDLCLQAVADVLREVQQEKVLFGRYGGDEFVLLYLNHTDEEIRTVAETIRRRVKEISKERSLPDLSVSQGICNRVPDAKDRLWDFSKAADDALYRVKTGGRGSVCLEGKK